MQIPPCEFRVRVICLSLTLYGDLRRHLTSIFC
nr:MAG TPA: hypothetical protein [Caudoviricetes sp.]